MEYFEVVNRWWFCGVYNVLIIGVFVNIKRLINCIIESYLKRYLSWFCVLEVIICFFGVVNEF